MPLLSAQPLLILKEKAIRQSHQSGPVVEVYPELAHGRDDGEEALDGVGVDDGPVVLALVRAVARLMDDLHLLDDGRLAALAGTWKAKQQG